MQEIAQSGLCQVFDIKKSQTKADYVDMSGSMLLCVLKKEAMKGKLWLNLSLLTLIRSLLTLIRSLYTHTGKLWHECLDLVVQWNNEQVLKQVTCMYPTPHMRVSSSSHACILLLTCMYPPPH